RRGGRFNPAYLFIGGAAGAAAGAAVGATVGWMECPPFEDTWCSSRHRHDQLRAVRTGVEVGTVMGLLGGLAYRVSRWERVSLKGYHPAIVTLRSGLGLGVAR